MLGYLYCYDLGDDRLRDRVASALLHHGLRVQESVYELWFHSEAEQKQLHRSLNTLFGGKRSFNLRWYRLSADALRSAGSFDLNPPKPPPSAVLWT